MIRSIIAVAAVALTTAQPVKADLYYHSIITDQIFECSRGERIAALGATFAGAVVGAMVVSKLPGGSSMVGQLAGSLTVGLTAGELTTRGVCVEETRRWLFEPNSRFSDLMK
jgi:hypothetical protein